MKKAVRLNPLWTKIRRPDIVEGEINPIDWAINHPSEGRFYLKNNWFNVGEDTNYWYFEDTQDALAFKLFFIDRIRNEIR